MKPNYRYYHKNEFRPLSSLSIHEIAALDCPGGYVLPLEKIDTFALYFVGKGKGVYTLSGTHFPVGEGDIFAMYPDAEIRCSADKKDPWSLLAVSFDGADARLLLNAARLDPKMPVRRLDLNTSEQVINLLVGMYTYRGQDIYGTTQSTAILYALMSLLVKTASWDQTAMPPGWTGAIHVQKALSFIAENYAKPITVNEIAAHVNLSRSRLYRVFMQHVFISPQQYLTEYRIREARTLLEKRSGSIKEISLAVGMEDPYRFSIQFKQICGKTPTQYMKYLIQFEKNKDKSEQ